MSKKRLVYFLSVVILVVTLSQGAFGESEEPMVVVFYEEDCPSCSRMEERIEASLSDHPNISIARYNLSEPGSLELLELLSTRYGVSATTVPVIFVGYEVIAGAGRAEELRLRTAIDECVSLGCSSPLAGTPRSGFPWRDFLNLGVFVSLFFFLLFLQSR